MKLTSDVRPDVDKLKHTGPVELGKIRAWSYSTLKVFEECPYRSYIAKVRRIAEPSGPAASRGSKIHQQAEDYVNGKLEELPDTLDGHFTSDFEQLKKLYKEGKVELEGEWGFDINWNPVKWLEKATWARIKLDAYVQQDEKSARVIDYKTGKKFGNEISHGQQCLLYAIGTFFRYPELEFVQAELWYLDQKSTTKKTYTRDQALMFAPGFHSRGLVMTTCTDYEPRPSKSNCKWCSYKNSVNDEPAPCAWGIAS